MTTPTQEWTNEQLLSDAVSKKDIVTFLHLSASHDFLVEFKLTGKLPTVVKNGKFEFPCCRMLDFKVGWGNGLLKQHLSSLQTTAKKDSLSEAYNSLFTRKAFRLVRLPWFSNLSQPIPGSMLTLL